MRRRVYFFECFIGLFSLLAIAVFTLSCEIGLGAAVDTEAPVVNFGGKDTSSGTVLNTIETGAVIRDSFMIQGTWSDDGSISDLSAVLSSTDGSRKKYETDGVITTKSGGKKGIWSVNFDPVAQGIKDGTYELSISISDSGHHTSKITRTIIIDNTPPLVVLSRPSTKKGAANIDSYGQKFTLEGKAADDNDVSLIEVNVYDNEACAGLPLQTIKLPNVPLTIEQDVATYSSTEPNAYAVIYGHVDISGVALRNGGTENRYCTLQVYDGAQRYPSDGSLQTEEDKKGNCVNYYYLNADVGELFTAGYKITELYHILNGTFNPTGAARTISASNAESFLADTNKQTFCGQFSLNPENSPHFVVSARSPLSENAAAGHLFDNQSMTNGNGALEVEIVPGLDGHLLKEETIGLYLILCDSNGEYLTDYITNGGTTTTEKQNAKRIPLIEPNQAAPGEVTQSGSTYKFKTTHNIGNAYYPALVVGNYYYVDVVGKDMQGNDIVSEGRYGFKLDSAGETIDLSSVTADRTYYTYANIANQTANTAYRKINVSLVFSGGSGSYKIYRKYDSGNADEIKSNYAGTTYTDQIALSSSVHPNKITYKIKDNGGIESNDRFIPQTDTILYDNTVPVVAVTGIPDEIATEMQKLTLSGTVNDSPNGEVSSGIKSVFVQISDTDGHTTPAFGATDAIMANFGGTEWSCQVDTKKAAYAAVFAKDGVKTVKVTARDGVEFVSDVATQTFNYDTQKPTVKITGSQLNGATSSSPSIPTIVGKTLTLMGTASDGTGSIATIVIEQKKEGESTSKTHAVTVGTAWTTVALPFKSETENYSATELENHVADGKYTYKIIVTDWTGKTASEEKTITLNTMAPVIDIQSPVFDITTKECEWQTTQKVMVSGTATSLASISAVYYKLLTQNDPEPSIPANPSVQTNWTNAGWKAAGTENWAFNCEPLDSATNKLYLAAVDSVGNTTDVIEKRTIKKDASSPELEALYYNFSGTNIYKTAEGQVYVDNTKSLIVYGQYKDAESGVTPLSFKMKNVSVSPQIAYTQATVTGEVTAEKLKNLSYNITTIPDPQVNTETSTKITYWKATFAGSLFSSTTVGEVKVSGGNNAGSPADEQKIFNLSYDDKKPTISNVAFATTAAAPYQVYKKSASEYWVNNKVTGAVFTVSGVATDNFGVEDVELKLDGTKQTRNANSSVSEWAFDIPLSGYEEGEVAEIKIQATDVAGKTSDIYEFTINFDQTKPLPKHWVDAKNKDVYFRIGSADNDYFKKPDKTYDTTKVESGEAWDNTKDKDVGKKYSFGSFGNDSTIEIRGTFKENGAGLRTLYYKIYNTTAPGTTEINNMINGTLPGGYKEFAPLTVPETRRVPYNLDSNGTTKASLEITSNYRVSLPGFDAERNYLVLIAEDNVGNRQYDMLKITDKTGTDNKIGAELTQAEISANPALNSNKWNSQNHNTETPYANLNKDIVPPNITSNIKQGLFTNGTRSITITGTANDELAGLATVTVSIDETVGTGAQAVSVKWSQELEAKELTDSGAGTPKENWTITVPASVFANIPSESTITAYATAADSAGVGNKKTISAATITIDTDEPDVTINPPKDADTTNDTVDVNGIISLSGTSNDTYGVSKVLGICYKTGNSATKPDKETPAEGSTWNAPNGWTKLADTTTLKNANATTNWTYENINTANLSGSSTIADGTTVWFTVAVQDKAGNVGYAKPQKVIVDQNTDRPIVKFTNLNKEGNSYILKYVENSILEGNISDDDQGEDAQDATKVVDIFVASSIPVTTAPVKDSNGWTKQENGNKIIWEKTECGKTEYNKLTGDYTFTPANPSDGPKEVYFYVKDNKEKEFYTAHSTSLNRPYEQYKQEAKASNNAKLEYKSDGTSPTISGVQLQAYTDSAKNGGLVELGTTTVVGGKLKNKIQFTVQASDANGIKEMSLTYKPTGGSEQTITSATAGSSFAATTNSAVCTWVTPLIPISSFGTGAVTVTVSVTDQSGLPANQNPVFMVDNSGPVINISSPGATDEVTGPVTIAGQAIDEGIAGNATIHYLVPTQTQKTEQASSGKTDLEYYATLPVGDGNWIGKLNGDTSASAFKYLFNGDTTNDNVSLDVYTKSDSSGTYGNTDDANGIYEFAMYFRSADALGNIEVKKFTIHYNPDADKPKTEISYPSESNYEGTNNFVTLGGLIRVTGSVSIPSMTTTPEKVYIQIGSEKENQAVVFNDTDKTKAGTGTNNYGYQVKTVADVATDIGKTVVGLKADAAAAWWGIEANRSSNAWSFNLNATGNLDPSGNDANKIMIRACGVNAEGKMGPWSDVVFIHIDASAPECQPKLYQFNGNPALDANGNPNATGERDYVPGMFVKGQWWLGLHLTDDQTVVIEDVLCDGSQMDLDGSDIKKFESTDHTAIDLFIKLDSNATNMKTYKVSARDAATGGYHWIYPSYDINIDNVAPQLSEIKTGAGYPIEMTKQRTSDNVITFGGTATDSGSGFERLAYYFKRGTGASQTIEIPVPDKVGSANQKTWKVGTAYTTLSSSLTTEDDLYGKSLSGTKAIVGETTTFTCSESLSSYTFIRKGGLVKLAGTYYLITNVTTNVITVNGKINSPVTTAFCPVAFIVDSTAAESPTWAGGVNTISGDDGDGVTESVRKAGNSWTWDTSIYASELDDGLVSLVCVAFDVAENSRKTETPFMLANKTPRLSKLYLATDLNGDGKYSDNELGTSVIKTSGSTTVEKYYSAINTGSLQEVFTVYGKFDDENNSTTESGITMRDKLGIAFEFVSGSGYEGYGAGQGDLKYKLTVGNSPLTANTGAQEGTNASLATATTNNYDNTDDTVTKTLIGKKFLEITPAMISGGSYGTYSEYLTSGETGYNAGTNYLNYLRITLWDSTNNAAGTKDGQKTTVSYNDKDGNPQSYEKYASFGAQWTTFNIPLYMDLIDGLKPTVEINNPVALSHTEGTGDDEHEVADGHVDLKSTLSSLTGSNEFDSDDKVSGKIKFTGTINDDKRVSNIKLTVNKNFSSQTVTGVTLATYNPQTGGFKVGTNGAAVTIGGASPTEIVPNSATGLKFKLLSNEFSTTDGHTVTWELEVDTELVASLAQANVIFTLTANDGVGDGTASHQVDIVPYITGLDRPNAKINTHRSRRGKYQVVLGESVDITGFNFPNTAATVTGAIKLQVTGQEKLAAGTVKTAITPANGYTVHSMSFTVPGTSGFIKVVTNGVSSVNNFNSGNEIINPDYAGDAWNDDVYLSVWKNDEYFYFSNDPISPSMDRVPNGNGQHRLYGGWGTQGSKVYASYPNTTGSGNTGNAPGPNNGGGTATSCQGSSGYGDPISYYDVAIDASGNRYNAIIDCWQGSGTGWGGNFVINKNGASYHNGCNTTNYGLGSNNMRHVIERMGAGGTSPDNANSSDGLDEIFNQFLNPRIVIYNGSAYITYYDRYAKCLKWAMSTPPDSRDNNPTVKYSTEGVITGGTYQTNHYKTGGMVVAGYDTLQTGGSQTNLNVGMWSDIAIDTTAGKPVIAYYDGTNRQLMIATSAGDTYPVNTNSPVLTGTATSATQGNAWDRQAVTGSATLRLGEYVSLALDGGNNIHIACKGAKDGALYYVYGEKRSYGTYIWAKPICVDNNGSPGTWTDIKLTNPGSYGAEAGPVISYYDPTNDDTEDALKVAYLESDSSFVAANWDTMTVPCNSAATANRITLALDVTDGVTYTAAGTSNNSKLAVGYVSSRFDCVYLRKE